MITAPSRKLFITACLFLGFLSTIQATHIIGGEMNYACLGNHQYEISLTVYRDCYLGEALMDDTAYVAVYDPLGLLVQKVPMLLGEIDTVLQPEDCLIVPPDICVETTVYKDTITLLPRTGGYHIAYQRCCRNATILNIVDPLNTGTTYEIIVTEEAMQACNASPKIKAWPPTFICANRPLSFDHSATDREGDSLVYSICTPFEGGVSLFNPRPRPAFPPPYQNVRWNEPTYSLDNVLGGIPLTIDASTGLLEGVPNTVGQFVVGICVEEYRNGELISTSKRDFQYNVIPCQDIRATFELPEKQCTDLPISPIYRNISEGHLTWKFFKDQHLVHTTTEQHPNFQAIQSGSYTIRLIVSANTSCIDSTDQIIELIPNDLILDFDYQFTGCQEDLQLSLRNTSPISTVFMQWVVQGSVNSVISLAQFPTIPIDYEDSLTVQLELINEAGCKNVLQKTIKPPRDSTDISYPTTVEICKGDSIRLLPSTVLSNYEYQWTATAGMVDSNIATPLVFPTATTSYHLLYGDSVRNCFKQAVVEVIVSEHEPDFDIAVRYECDGNSVSLLPAPLGAYDWDFGDGNILKTTLKDTLITHTYSNTGAYTIKVRTKDPASCEQELMIPILLQDKELEISFPPLVRICAGVTETLDIQSASPLIFSWTEEDQPLEETTAQLVIQPTQSTSYQFEAQNEAGCTFVGSIEVEVLDLPDVEITSNTSSIIAGMDLVLNATYYPDYQYQWSPTPLLDHPNSANPSAFPVENTSFSVVVTDENGCTAASFYEVKVNTGDCVPPYIFLPNAFTPNGDGENDVLYVRGQVIKDVQLIIYDRWGDKVFESNNQQIGWDGTKNGIPQPSGVFGYYLSAKCFNEEEYYTKGNITLIR